MTTKLAGGLAAGALAIGILVGAGGTVLVHTAGAPATAIAEMTQMHQSMRNMMSVGTGMRHSNMVDPAGHALHHAAENR